MWIIFYSLIFFILNNQSNNANTTNNTTQNITVNTFCNNNIANCLSCKGNSCLFCDIFNGYYPNNTNTACEKCNIISSNCAFSLICGTCQICKNNYTLCSGNCIPNINNCAVGNSCIGVCTMCSSGFYWNNGTCSPVITKVTNCLEYSSNTNCSECFSGYKLVKNNDNIQICEPLNIKKKLISNCFVHLGSINTCNSCISNSGTTFFNFNIMNPYKLLQERILVDDISELRTSLKTYTSISSFSFLIDKNMVCQSQTILNCLEANSSFQCITCKENYYLQNGNCLRIQQEKIKGCIVYETIINSIKVNGYNQVRCKTCDNNTYLKEGKCLTFKIINGCNSYNLDRTNCNGCDSTKGYTFSNNTCIRSNEFTEVPNCNIYNTQGICIGCIARYALLTGTNTCGNIINCAIVNSGTILTCTTCDTGHVLGNNNTTCTPLASNLNCLENSPQTSNTCSVCKANYFVDNNNICTNMRNGSINTSNCAEGESNYFCKKCNVNHIKVPQIFECFTQITDCIYYNTDGTCLLCGNGMIPNTTNQMACDQTPITSINECAIYDNTVCRSCNPNFLLQANGAVFECVTASLASSTTFCSYNPISGLNGERLDPNNITSFNNNVVPVENNCRTCLGSFLLDTVIGNRDKCVPPLPNGSTTDPYKYRTCQSGEIRIRFQNNDSNVYNGNTLTCRSITSITAPTVANSIYQLDQNCYIYKTLPVTSFIVANTLCAICNHGYTLTSPGTNMGLRCTSIDNCATNNTYFGGCFSCNTGFKLDIGGEICGTVIDNCKVQVGNDCIECNTNFVGTLRGSTTLTNTDTGLIKLLGFGNNLLINNRINNIKIPKYKYFFYNSNSEFKFSSCSQPTNLVRNALNPVNPHVSTLTTQERNRVLAINNGETFAAYCRLGNFMRYTPSSSGSPPSNFHCSSNSDNQINNIFDNNYLNQAISTNCLSGGTLVLSIKSIKGPFCVSTSINRFRRFDNPVILNFRRITNCNLIIFDWDYRIDSLVNQNNVFCLFCGSGNILNSTSKECNPVPNANTIIVSTCLAYDSDRNCMTCPANMIMVNNACVNETQPLYTGMTLMNFRTNYNCNKVAWKQNLSGIEFRQSFENISSNNNDLIATCETCLSNMIMNYSNFTCISANKFNFDNCLLTQNGVGCVSCRRGYIQFESNSQLELCINNTNNSDFVNNNPIENCNIYNLNSSNLYECIICNTGFILENNMCQQNTTNIENCMEFSNNSINTCSLCNNGFYLNGNSCLKGNIYKCLGYSSQYICNRCDTGYILWNTSNNGTRIGCLDSSSIRSSLGNDCPEVRAVNASTSQQLYCYCSNGKIPLKINNPINNSICLPYPINIPNCKTYNSADLTQCSECNYDLTTNTNTPRYNLFILKNNKCEKKEVISNCNIYVENIGMCHTCNEGYYLNSSGICIINPDGLANCRYPLPDKSCPLCKSNYYLNNKICIPVPEANRTTNCYRYNSNSPPTCIICNKGFLLNLNVNPIVCEVLNKNSPFIDENNTCKFDILKGYENNKCVCLGKNYYFDIIKKKCIKILYCIKSGNNGICTQCDSRRYYNSISKSCDFVTKIVNNCNLYSSNGICSRCLSNYGLVNNTCISVSNIDRIENCDSYNDNPKCLLCNPGQYTNNGSCKNLTNPKIYFSSYNNESLALICKPGYTMNVNRNCVANSSPNNTTTISNSNIKINIITLLFIIILLNN